jgi:hypothetical protein
VKGLAKALKILGYILLYTGVALIAFGILSIWWFEGFGAAQEVLSPFNVINYIATALTLAPGFLLIWASEKLNKNSTSTGTEK